MKVIILAGGRGTRISEETSTRPKPMVEIGGKPIIWHIMKVYAGYGYKEFMIACGYKGEHIKEYFNNYFIHQNDYVIDLKDGSRQVIKTNSDDWQVGLIDTGIETQTGGRILRLKTWLTDDRFFITYGDGVGNINISDLLAFHLAHGRLATVTALRPPATGNG